MIKKGGNYSFKINDINIVLNMNRKQKKRCRTIELKDKNNNTAKINFNRFPSFKIGDKLFKLGRLDKCLSKQLDFFLNYRKTNNQHYSLVENKKRLIFHSKKINFLK